VKRWLIAGAVGGVCLVVLFPLLFFVIGQPAAACGTAAAGDPAVPASTVTGGKQIGQYTPAQVAVAAQIIAAGKSLGVSPRGQTIGIMTGIGESGLAPIDVGDAAGPDSRGVFQQRSSGWGTYAQRMDPYQSAISFFKVLLTTPYDTMTPTAAAHKVQVNQDPNYYTKFWPDAVDLYSKITGDASISAGVTVQPVSAPVAPCTPCPPAGGAVPAGGAAPAGSDPKEAGLDPAFVAKWESYKAAVKAELGVDLTIASGYRSEAEQQVLWDQSDKSGRMVAAPGHSNHNKGLAIDQSTNSTPEMRAVAARFGLTFPMDYEPWHIEPVDARAGGANHDGPLSVPAATTCTAATASGGFALPLPRAVLTVELLAKPHHDHPGSDLPAPTGTPIYAVEGGTVTTAGPVSGYGNNFVAVKDANGWTWYYGHGSAHNVTVGQVVKAGDQVASVGSEGFSTGPHLHLGLNGPGQSVPTTEPSYCPQAVTLAVWNSQPVPDLPGLSTTACKGPPL
jgi:hypothetical protein